MKNLQNIVAEVLNLPLDTVNDNVSRNLQEEWDSFNHLLMISEIEKQLNVTFSIDEVASLKTYKELKDLVAAKRRKMEKE